jgi:hypothetical protein
MQKKDSSPVETTPAAVWAVVATAAETMAEVTDRAVAQCAAAVARWDAAVIANGREDKTRSSGDTTKDAGEGDVVHSVLREPLQPATGVCCLCGSSTGKDAKEPTQSSAVTKAVTKDEKDVKVPTSLSSSSSSSSSSSATSANDQDSRAGDPRSLPPTAARNSSQSHFPTKGQRVRDSLRPYVTACLKAKYMKASADVMDRLFDGAGLGGTGLESSDDEDKYRGIEEAAAIGADTVLNAFNDATLENLAIFKKRKSANRPSGRNPKKPRTAATHSDRNPKNPSSAAAAATHSSRKPKKPSSGTAATPTTTTGESLSAIPSTAETAPSGVQSTEISV